MHCINKKEKKIKSKKIKKAKHNNKSKKMRYSY